MTTAPSAAAPSAAAAPPAAANALPPPAPPDTAFRRLAIAVVALLMLARIVGLIAGRTDLYVDEAQYWTWAQALDWGYFSKPPLIAVLIAATTGLFGDGEWAVRLSAPLLHGATALVLMALGDRLYGGRAGPLAAVLYATLPAVSLSATLISTDVPLLFAWALGLLAAVRLARRDDWPAALGFGAAVALGINAKYPMIFLPGLVLLAFALDAALRPRLASPRLWAGILIGLAGFLPNLIWNVTHDFATFRHTGYNANWGGRGPDLGSMLEFAGAQAGVFGPLLLLALVLAALRIWRSDRPAADRFLLSTSLPVLAVFIVQALVSDANANWAATAYPGATVLVAALLAAPGRRRLLGASLALHGLVAAALIVGPAFASALTLPGGRRPFERVLGWHAFADRVADLAAETGSRSLVVARRADAAALLYYLRDAPLGVAVLVPDPAHPQDHYQMTRPVTAALASPALVILPSASQAAALGPPWTPAGPERVFAVSRGVSRALEMRAIPVVRP